VFDTIIRGATVLTPRGRERLDVAIQGGRVAALLAPGEAADARETIDAAGKHVLPGAIDIHFHVRAPAHPARGTWETESRAAAAGGVTTVFEMPISTPCCATEAVFHARVDLAARGSVVNYAFYGAPGLLDEREVLAMADAGAIGYKIFTTALPKGREDEFQGLCVPTEPEQLRALELVRETGRVLVVHAESEPLLEFFTARVRATGRNDPATHGESRPPLVEALAIAKIATMNEAVGARLHIAHVTSGHALETLRRFRGGQDLSGETCPQYLLFTEADLERHGSYAKINPPLRTDADREALWAGVVDGTLDAVTTDHSPFTVEEKERARSDFWAAPPGAPGVETLVPFLLDAAASGRITLERAVDLMGANGARRFGLYPKKGVVDAGADADLIVVDLEADTVVDRERLFTQSRGTDRFFHGMRFRGRVERTLVNGRTVFRDGEVIGKPGEGSFVRP
jgi:allantoinase